MTILDKEQRLIRAENVIIAFPHLYQPQGMGEAKYYSVESILDPNNPQHQQVASDILTITREIVQAQGLPNANPDLMSPLKVGDQINQERAAKAKAPRPELIGKWMMRAADGRNPPVVYDQQKLPLPETQSANIFGGCVCHVIFNLYWRKRPDNPGVSAGLKIVQLVNNVGVDRFGGAGISDDQAQSYLLDVPGAPLALAQGGQSAGPMPVQSQPSQSPWGTPQPSQQLTEKPPWA